MQTETVRRAYREAAAEGTGAPKVPAIPNSFEEAGLKQSFVSDLMLKTLYTYGSLTGGELSDRICLPFTLLDEELLALQARRVVEVRGTEGHGRRSYVFDLTGEGRTRARELSLSNAYVGPAPVPSDTYRWWVAVQSVRNDPVPRDRIRAGLSHLVLDEAFVDRLGPGINSGKSVFLYGHPGNGKTEIAFSIAGIMGTHIYVPHAVEMEGQIIKIYDPYIHKAEDAPPEAELGGIDASILRNVSNHDPRFVRIRRPAVIVGGELTLEELNLQDSGQPGVHIAPPQMKSNGGVFVIDDFGRQQVRPRDLLNRWMIPLDRGTDYLGLPTGHKLEIPFDCLVFFATNLNPSDLVEEAFLRRIRYKIFMPNPKREQFAEILRRVCAKRDIEYREEAVDLIYREFYARFGIEPRSCHPGDIVADVVDHARYLGRPAELEEDLVMNACLSYFIDMPKLAAVEYDDITQGASRG
jgi:energy-coupling factor transporter ATP-binding protein EcfA2